MRTCGEPDGEVGDGGDAAPSAVLPAHGAGTNSSAAVSLRADEVSCLNRAAAVAGKGRCGEAKAREQRSRSSKGSGPKPRRQRPTKHSAASSGHTGGRLVLNGRSAPVADVGAAFACSRKRTFRSAVCQVTCCSSHGAGEQEEPCGKRQERDRRVIAHAKDGPVLALENPGDEDPGHQHGQDRRGDLEATSLPLAPDRGDRRCQRRRSAAG